MDAAFAPQIAGRAAQQEWDEFQRVLRSDLLSKSPNAKAFLSFIAEKYFTGTSDEIKEYSIAVLALRRPPSFDSQTDTIVRVTAHALRKRLKLYYETEGFDHPVHMDVPLGRYVLRFVRKEPVPEDLIAPTEQLRTGAIEQSFDGSNLPPSRPMPMIRLRRLLIVASVLAACGVASFIIHRRSAVLGAFEEKRTLTGVPGGGEVQRFLLGDKNYSDSSGSVWIAAAGCRGGVIYHLTDRTILGTQDQALYSQGRSGKFTCAFPVDPGSYEIRFLLADTVSNEANVRHAQFSVNERLSDLIDIADMAGSSDRATAVVLANIHPGSDGAIHIQSNAEAVTSAIQITRTPADLPAPFHMVTGPIAVHDDSGVLWQADTYFVGGRQVIHPSKVALHRDSHLYAWDRMGHFRYLIPVAKGYRYKLTLYMSEGWFGGDLPGGGGKGSRVFSIYCNGKTLMHDFDLLSDPYHGTADPTFGDIQPTSQGLLEIDFIPGANYPTLNAIAIEAERGSVYSKGSW